MISLPGYKITKERCRGNQRIYYDGVREQDDTPVIIKTHFVGPKASNDTSNGTPDDRDRLRHEYEVLKNLKGKGISEIHAIEPCTNGFALILKHMDGLMLSEYIGTKKTDLAIFLEIAISAVEILSKLHRQNIIHKDIQPKNILINKNTHQIWLVDFRFATVLPREKSKILNLAAMEGSLAYMSPEQTGRMNRDLDYRTDFYSLGVLFYQMLTGHLPFDSTDPLELVHAHLAKQPEAPNRIDKEIPGVVSEIIMKLLSKNAEDRYLSGHGLIEDLKTCRHQLKSASRIEPFPLAEEDFPEKLRISQKIYGRDQEIEKLLDIFVKTSRQSTNMAVISGNPGVGKTSLVQEIHKPITQKNGYFISGKFDPFHQNVPYSALVLAFAELVKQLLAESEENLRHWKVRLLSTLGVYGQIIIDVIPDMELVIGLQPPVKKVDAVEAQNRFNRVMMNFVRVFCDPKHPLVIFLDDLQWVDTATLKLIEGVMTGDNIQHLFLIGSYRDNEVIDTHPLFTTLKKLEQENCAFSRIHLNPLKTTDITRLIADTLQSGKRPVGPLAELVVAKTGGNPFFVNQFLMMLYQEKLLFFNAERRCWEWQLQAIKALGITENVVELLLSRLESMPIDTQKTMMMAACIGSNFDLKTLRTITGYSDSEIITHLLPAIREDLVVTTPKDNVGSTNGKIMPAMTEHFKFRHDRVRQASYALIADEDKKTVHLKIGRLLFEDIASHRYEENIFDVIHHLNMATDLIHEQQERDETAELNLVAGNKAKTLAAFEPAFNYFANGLQFLDKHSWHRQYNLTLQLHVESAEAARLCRNFKKMEKFFEIVRQNARTVLDRVDVYQTRVHAFITEDRRLEALDLALEILKEIGTKIPAHPTEADVRSTLNKTIADLSEHKITDLLKMPEMNDPCHLAAMKIMGSVVGPSYQISPDRFVLLVCHQINLSVRYGNVANSAAAYVAFGVILCGYADDIDMGHRFGRLGLELLKRFDAKELEARVFMIFYTMVHHWKFPLRNTLEFLLAGYNSGLETGDFEFGSYSAVCYSMHSLFAGKALDETEREARRFGDAFKQLKQEPSVIYNSIFHQTILNLLGKNDFPSSMTGEIYDEGAMLPLHRKSGDTTALFYMHVCKIMLCYLFNAYQEAILYANQVEDLVPGFFLVPVYRFYESLSRLAVYDSLSKEKQKQMIAKVNTNQSMMKKWMIHAPENHEHKFYLVEAEMARIRNDIEEAAKYYNHAIKLARENGYRNEEALANELAAKFWLDRDQYEFAGIFMRSAHKCYTLWGASGKAEHLFENYPQLFFSLSNDSPTINNSSYPLRNQTGLKQEGLDIASLMKASQTISSEIVFDNLLKTMMKIVIENAGVERGILILNSEGQFRIVAKGIANADEIVVQSCDAVSAEAEQLPASVINYVVRTRERLLVNNPANESRFGNDPYIRKFLPKSVLCIPIIYQSKLSGAIYLENRLTPDVFSPDRIEVLRLLTSQIAISIENTLLFEKNRKAEEQYRGIFENAVEGIFQSDPEGQFLSANPAMAHILGYDSPEDLCVSISDIKNQIYVSPEQREKTLQMLRKNETVADFEVAFRRKDGVHIWVSLSARSLFDENGKLLLIEGFVVDISERKAATDALREREQSLRKENIRLRSDIKDRFRFGSIIGKSPAMQEVYELILKAATTEASVIIYGESGTGKELVAKEIHEMSDRKNSSFVPVNCGAIPENLFESEFFGYKKGAFTGANTDKKGYLDQSHEGTLFLDELGEINLNFQVKLLRALEGSYTPLGSQIIKESNARIVAATNRDLQEAIRKGAMREDFYYRVHIIPIHLPPLRNRKEDIPLLVEHFLKIHSSKKNEPPITGKILEAMLSYDWPGNVRELQNVLHRYCTLGQIDFFPTLPNALALLENNGFAEETDAPEQDYQEIMGNVEKKLIIKALEHHQWNRDKAAKYLKIPRTSFFRKLKQHNIVKGN